MKRNAKQDTIERIVLGVLIALCISIICVGVFNAIAPAMDEDEQIIPTEGPAVVKNVNEETGVYNKKGFGSEYYIHRFSNTDIVVYQVFDSAYVVGEDSKEETGISYGSICEFGSKFLALSDEYILLTEEGEKIAFELKEKQVDGRLINESIPFEDLSIEKQQSFSYPMSFEKMTK